MGENKDWNKRKIKANERIKAERTKLTKRATKGYDEKGRRKRNDSP